MTPNKINRAIAEACGWKPLPVPVGHGGIPLFDKEEWKEKTCPNYHGDLNAMHEAEGTLTPRQLETYWRELLALNGNHFPYALNATAAQRAEAFLRTIGKWEDGE